jgi:hypothetical protein
MLDYASAPNGIGEAYRRYIEHQIPLGSFGMALLRNNLRETLRCADDVNTCLLVEHVNWLYNEFPCDAWGSDTNVDKWLKKPKPSSLIVSNLIGEAEAATGSEDNDVI